MTGLAKFIIITVLVFLFLYLIAWIPVVDRFVRWCEHYPNSLEDCRKD